MTYPDKSEHSKYEAKNKLSQRALAELIARDTISKLSPGGFLENAISAKTFGSTMIIAIGKAAYNMALAAKNILGDKALKTLVITSREWLDKPSHGMTVLPSSHPLPSDDTVSSTQAAIDAVKTLPDGAEILFLISGGGSSMFEIPAEGITLAESAALNKRLIESGANIQEINAVRKRMSAVKGGRFAELCGGRKIHTMILSDVPGGKPDFIASGPVLTDSGGTELARETIERYKIKLSPAQQAALDTPLPVIPSEHSEVRIIADSGTACRTAAAECERHGYKTRIFTDRLNGEARSVGADIGRTIAGMFGMNLKGHQAFIFGGETTVTVRGKGKGGRAQELALAAALEVSGLDCAIASFGTDGIDGKSSAAGAVVDGKSAGLLEKAGVDIKDALSHNDSNTALRFAELCLVTGETGTNLNDLIIVLCRF